MHIEIDKYSQLKSPIHSMDVRAKIIIITLIAFIFSSLKSISASCVALFFSIFILLISKLPFSFIFQRIKVPILFLIPLFIFLPFSSGGEIHSTFLGFNIYSKGINLSIIIFLKTISIVVLFLIMMSTSTFILIASALRELKVPEKLVSMILFTYRYIFVYLDDLRKMRTSLKLRGFKNRNNIRSLKSSTSLIGSLLIRSFEQTERIYHAMILRGYTGKIYFDSEFKLQLFDVLFFIFLLIISSIILLYDNLGFKFIKEMIML